MKKTIDFMGRRRLWYSLSVAVILVGLVFLAFRGLNLGIDFSSGTIITYDLKANYEVSAVKTVVTGQGLGKAIVRNVANQPTQVEIHSQHLDDEGIAKLTAAMKQNWPNATAEIPASVDPVFSRDLLMRAVYALSIAFVGMIAYITWRFEFKFAVTAIVALLHDVLVVIGMFAIFRWEVNSEFVAAILTIVGYSINDTIVVFDRIRERLKLKDGAKDLPFTINASITETMPRTINTSATTLLAIAAVLFFGGATLRPLSTALVIGIISGTYSSIFIASALWLDWKSRDRVGSSPAPAKARA